MTTFAIPDTFSFSGDWWVPHDTDAPAAQVPTSVAGVLTWKTERATLELHGALKPLRGVIYAGDEQLYGAIHGTTTQSQLITLLNARRFGSPISFGRAGVRETERVCSSWVVIGAHVTAQSQFTEIEARIPGLPLWLGQTGGEQTLQLKSADSPSAVMYTFHGLPEDTFEVASLPGVIGFGICRDYSGNLDSNVSIRTSAYIRIRPTEPKSLEWLIDSLGRTTTLLGLISGSPMAPECISVKTSPDNQDCEVLVALREAKYCKCEHAREFFMGRPHMEADLGVVLSKWFDLYDSIAMSCQLALSVLYSEKLWLHVEFLSLMQALEGLHRAIMPGAYVSKEDYEPTRKLLIDTIPQSITKDHRDALKSKIKYGYEFSLNKRLGLLVNRLDQPIREHILGDAGSVPRSWIETRNYYTHWDETERRLVLDGTGMHRAGVRMKLLLRALYLDVIGIPSPSILRSLGNQLCDESAYLIQLNNMEHRKKNPASSAGALMRIDLKNGPGEP